MKPSALLRRNFVEMNIYDTYLKKNMGKLFTTLTGVIPF